MGKEVSWDRITDSKKICPYFSILIQLELIAV